MKQPQQQRPEFRFKPTGHKYHLAWEAAVSGAIPENAHNAMSVYTAVSKDTPQQVITIPKELDLSLFELVQHLDPSATGATVSPGTEN